MLRGNFAADVHRRGKRVTLPIVRCHRIHLLRLDTSIHTPRKDRQLAKPNYDFAKRQKELAKKAKKEEKRLRKLAAGETPSADDDADAPDDDASKTPETPPA